MLINKSIVGLLNVHWPQGAPESDGEATTTTKKFGEWSFADLQLDLCSKMNNIAEKEETSD